MTDQPRDAAGAPPLPRRGRTPLSSSQHEDKERLEAFLRQRDLRRAKAELARLHTAAREQGVECLNTTFEGIHALYRFRCPAGHEWDRKGDASLQRNACPHCAEASRLTVLDEALRIAKELGGRCLTEHLKFASTEALWCCRHGHRWRAQPREIRHGTWCPECSDQVRLLVLRGKRRRGSCHRQRLHAINDKEDGELEHDTLPIDTALASPVEEHASDVDPLTWLPPV